MSISNLAAKLAEVTRNGSAEVGLEVGVDPGLSRSNFVKIPKSLSRRWAVVVDLTPYEEPEIEKIGDKVSQQHPAYVSDEIAATYGANRAWVHDADTLGNITYHNRTGLVRIRDTLLDFQVVAFYQEPITEEMARDFYYVNQGALGDTNSNHIAWVIATRFWTTVAGLVVSPMSVEYEPVTVKEEDRIDTKDKLAAYVDLLGEFQANAVTAAAARAGSWRKTNHATGGTPATGFPRRWLSKMGYWPTTNDRKKYDEEARAATTAFYMATHPVSVHSALALMAPSVSDHWTKVNPSYGFILNWDTKKSVEIRLAPNTQVAGGAMIADSMVVLKNVVRDSLVPMLRNGGEISALVNLHRTLENNGMKCAVYAKWFFSGAPPELANAVVDFSQKDSTVANLVGELAAVAIKYYAGSTISKAASLAAAMEQLADTTSVELWSSLAAEKVAASSEAIIGAYKVIRSGVSAGALSDLATGSEEQVRKAVETYNNANRAAAVSCGIGSSPDLSADQVIATRGLGQDKGKGKGKEREL